jgi:hypothetical protein
MINIGIVGSRRMDTDDDLFLCINKFVEIARHLDTEIQIVSGGCKLGGDRFAEIIAKEFNIPILIHYPDKSKLPLEPKRWDFARINYDRNTDIARDSDILIAVVARDRKGGTEDTIKKYKKFKKDNLVLV